jgi:hypothetical protein
MAAEIFRYWVEIRDLREDSTRNLPLKAFTRIHLRTRKARCSSRMSKSSVCRMG